MLYTLLLTLIIIDGVILAAVVLLQAGQGGGLASLGGGTADLVLGGRQAVTILHKASWVSGALFMFLALLLSIVASQRSGIVSGVQRQLQQGTPVQQTAPVAPLQTVPQGNAPAPSPTPTPPPNP
ncbi:MAG TPA: preprotein translocase subunit SecG [Gemmatimonadales bacterium]|nr:preprotein translocase subunit SecG [Gemmatimonadales bacterium]